MLCLRMVIFCKRIDDHLTFAIRETATYLLLFMLLSSFAVAVLLSVLNE